MTHEINRFMAEAVASMDDETARAWDLLSDFERKMIVAQNFFFVKNYNDHQTRKLLGA